MFFQLKPFCLFVLVQRELDKLVTTVDKLVSGRWTVDGGQKRLQTKVASWVMINYA